MNNVKSFTMLSIHDEFSIEESTPDSLHNLSLKAIVNNLNYFTTTENGLRKILDHVVVPAEICEKFLHMYQENYIVSDNILHMFEDREHCFLRVVKLRNARITYRGLQWIMKYKPVELELINCNQLNYDTCLDLISSNSQNLKSLTFGPVNPKYTSTAMIVERDKHFIDIPQLECLTIYKSSLVTFSPTLMTRFPNLTYLDLSDCVLLKTICTMNTMSTLQNLRYLILHNVSWTGNDIKTEWILTLKRLKFLDISQANERVGKYSLRNSSQFLYRIVENLRELEGLDISGTDLAGNGSSSAYLAFNKSTRLIDTQIRCDIPGLERRVLKPLEFLGLYGTHHAACQRHHLPAKVISGDANEEQIITAAVMYMKRPVMLTRILNDLYYLFRHDSTQNIPRALSIVLTAMETHRTERHIQISGSAILFYIAKGKEKIRIGVNAKRRMITVLLDGMEAHLDDETMIRNGCLTLCQFKIPSDVLFEYKRVVRFLLYGVADVNHDGFVQRITIYLLNSLACQVDGNQKRFLGNHGAITKMLNLISDRLKRQLCDDVLEVAWSTMWNVTDETPQNSQRFLEYRGMEYFLYCLQSFPNKEELLRNMMGLLGNVAEVPELRPQLMSRLFIEIFYRLLDSCSDGIEVSYNAAGVLAHIASDGPEAWTVEEPARDEALARLATVINRWQLRAERNINYRSFEPILGLLHAYHTPECQHWAVWALANLTTVYPEKYCTLVEDEGGLSLLQELLKRPEPYEQIKCLANVVITNCADFKACHR